MDPTCQWTKSVPVILDDINPETGELREEVHDMCMPYDDELAEITNGEYSCDSAIQIPDIMCDGPKKLSAYLPSSDSRMNTQGCVYKGSDDSSIEGKSKFFKDACKSNKSQLECDKDPYGVCHWKGGLDKTLKHLCPDHCKLESTREADIDCKSHPSKCTEKCEKAIHRNVNITQYPYLNGTVCPISVEKDCIYGDDECKRPPKYSFSTESQGRGAGQKICLIGWKGDNCDECVSPLEKNNGCRETCNESQFPIPKNNHPLSDACNLVIEKKSVPVSQIPLVGGIADSIIGQVRKHDKFKCDEHYVWWNDNSYNCKKNRQKSRRCM